MQTPLSMKVIADKGLYRNFCYTFIMNKKHHSFQRGALHFSLAILLAGIITFGTMVKNTVSSLINHRTATPAVETQTQTSVDTTPVAVSTDTSATAATSSSKNCGTDMDCFIAQAATCGPAVVEYSSTTKVFDTINVYNEINMVVGKTATANTCSFVGRLDVVRGTTLDGKKSESYSDDVGTKMACTVPAAKLVTLLKDWKQNTFNSGDLVNYNCKTTLSAAAAASQKEMQENDDSKNPNRTYSGLGEGSSMYRGDYSFNVTAVTSNSLTMDLKGKDDTAVAVPVTLTINNPKTYFGYTFTLTAVKDGLLGYGGTVFITPAN